MDANFRVGVGNGNKEWDLMLVPVWDVSSNGKHWTKKGIAPASQVEILVLCVIFLLVECKCGGLCLKEFGIGGMKQQLYMHKCGCIDVFTGVQKEDECSYDHIVHLAWRYVASCGRQVAMRTMPFIPWIRMDLTWFVGGSCCRKNKWDVEINFSHLCKV